jgi:hypothetical protein
MSVASFEVVQESVAALITAYTTGQLPVLDLGLVMYLVLGSATLLKCVCWAVCASLQSRSDSMLALAEVGFPGRAAGSCGCWVGTFGVQGWVSWFLGGAEDSIWNLLAGHDRSMHSLATVAMCHVVGQKGGVPHVQIQQAVDADIAHRFGSCSDGSRTHVMSGAVTSHCSCISCTQEACRGPNLYEDSQVATRRRFQGRCQVLTCALLLRMLSSCCPTGSLERRHVQPVRNPDSSGCWLCAKRGLDRPSRRHCNLSLHRRAVARYCQATGGAAAQAHCYPGVVRCALTWLSVGWRYEAVHAFMRITE